MKYIKMYYDENWTEESEEDYRPRYVKAELFDELLIRISDLSEEADLWEVVGVPYGKEDSEGEEGSKYVIAVFDDSAAAQAFLKNLIAELAEG